MEAVREIYFKLLKVTSCKNCGKKLSRRVTTCERGHTACEACYDSLSSCACCSGEFFDRHHVFYTKVLSALRDKANYLDKLFELIECPICYDTLTCPSWTCWNGHITCGRCYFYTSACPLCREEFADLYNTDINGLLGLLEAPIDCVNKPFGCALTDKYPRLKDHEKICQFSQYRCLISGCPFSGFVDKLPYHVMNSHPKSVLKANHNLSVDFEVTPEDGAAMISSGVGHYWLKYRSEGSSVAVCLVFIGPQASGVASLSIGDVICSVPVSAISDPNAFSSFSRLSLDSESRNLGKTTWCSLTLNSKRSSWLVNTVFLAALAANITFAIIIIEKNMH